MNKKNWLFYLIAVLAIMAFFTVSLGGCGGSSSHSGWSQNGGTDNPDPENPDNPDEPETPDEPNPTRKVWEQDTAINLNNAKAGFDFDGNGRMDFLDFDGVGQFHLGENVNAAGLPRNSSYRAASEAKISVPAMVWLEELRPVNENPNIFQVYLESDKEYTFEFSRNLTEAIDSNIPELEIFDPENAALPFIEATPLRPDTIRAVPEEHPSLILYTIKPQVSGYYLVRVSSQKSSTESYVESEDLNIDDVSAADSEVQEIDSGCVIFVYQEQRNEDNETGYYTRYKFSDINGNKTDTISLRDIIQLRKLFLEENPTYIDTVYGQNAEDDEYGDNDTADFSFSASTDIYLNHMNRVQDRLGLIDPDSIADVADDAQVSSAKARIADLHDNINENIVLDPDGKIILDSADQALLDALDELYSDDAPSYDPTKQNTTQKVLVDAGDLYGAGTQRSTIQSDIAGIPYEPTYALGTCYSAITNMNPSGAITGVELDEMIDEAYTPETIKKIPLDKKFWVEVITTREDGEKHSEVTAGGGVSLAKNATGTANFSVGTSSNYKYGLTSMTLVIHFEAVETQYRKLTPKGYNEFAVKNGVHKEAKRDTPDEFRDSYGDYFVAGYQYGACYEASISMTTENTEQFKELKSSFNASGTYNEVTVSVDMKQKMHEALNKSGAQFNISIVTTGLGAAEPTSIPITNSTDIAAIDKMFNEYVKFYANISKELNEGHRENFRPLRVYLMRWRSLKEVALAQKKWKGKKDDEGNPIEGVDGTIPITPEQFGEAQAMNIAVANLRAYYNAASMAKSTAAVDVKNRIDPKLLMRI